VSEPLRPTAEQIAAARLRVVLDQRSGRPTLPVVEELARMSVPDEDVVTPDAAAELGEPTSASSVGRRGDARAAGSPRARRRQSVAGNRTSAVHESERLLVGTSPEPELTVREREVLGVIRRSVERLGYPPSVREIGEAVGLTSTSSVARLLRALEQKGYLRRDPNRPRALGVIPAETDPEPSAKTGLAQVPVVGRIAAGGPIGDAVADEDAFLLPREIAGDGSLFLLLVTGDSMVDAAIVDGDWVVVREQPTVENGDIIAVMVEGDAVVTTYEGRDGQVWLRPRNSAYEPVSGDDAAILGVVVAVLRPL
jgi:repressor LexA